MQSFRFNLTSMHWRPSPHHQQTSAFQSHINRPQTAFKPPVYIVTRTTACPRPHISFSSSHSNTPSLKINHYEGPNRNEYTQIAFKRTVGQQKVQADILKNNFMQFGKENGDKLLKERSKFMPEQIKRVKKDRSEISAGYHRNNPCLKDFLLLEKIGEGSTSKVYTAVEKHSNFLCALKEVPLQNLLETKALSNLIMELKVQSVVVHPTIAKVYGYFYDANTRMFYIIQEYCTKKTLSTYLREWSREEVQNPLIVKSVLYQICNGLNELHSIGIIHRDVKPQNILIGPGYTVKLIDFNWSAIVKQKERRKTICGTPLYLAPEIVEEKPYSFEVDIWAVGILGFQIATGQFPMQMRSLADLKNFEKEQIEKNLEVVKDLQLKSLLRGALQKNVNQRSTITTMISHPYFCNAENVRCSED